MARRGYTIVELVVAMSIFLIIVVTVFYFYMNFSNGLQKAAKEIEMLSSIRTASAAIEKQLRNIVMKSGYVPGDTPEFKALSAGMFRIQWPGAENHLNGYAGGAYQDGRCRYLGFYTSSDGAHTDRIEYWFNPAEPKALCANGADDDADDNPDDVANPLHTMRDDRGRLMMRRVRDTEISYAQFAAADSADAPGFPAYRAPRLTGAAGSEPDPGEIVLEGINDIYFEFLYSKMEADGAGGTGLKFRCAQRWPVSADLADSRKDDTAELWPRDSSDGRTPRGVSFLTLPLAVRVTYEVQFGAETRHYQQTLPLPQSQWTEFTRRRN